MAESSNNGAGEGTEAPQGTAGGSGEENATPTVEELQAQLDDWKGHARKHEQRAKDNAEAAKRLADLEREKLSDDERRSADLTAAEQRAQEAEQAAEKATRDAIRYRLAAKHGISDEHAELYLTGSDEETMTKQAVGLAALAPRGNHPNPAQGRRGADAASGSVDEQGAAALSALFND